MAAMDAPEAARAAANLRTALELHDLGVALYAQRLRRESPDASEERIRAALILWLHGSAADAVGA
jgi:Rv0078B-related antitoxin